MMQLFLTRIHYLILWKFLKKTQKLKLAQPKIIDFTNQEKFEYSGAAGGFIDFLATLL